MSNRYWRMIATNTVFVLACAVTLRADDTVQQLPFCNPHILKDGSSASDLIIVSTLDGKLTAFSTENGFQAWMLQTPPLLSSNLHHVELTSGGKWVRLVPSLSGGLYTVSGDSVEPLPFDAEQLLSSSFKYSDDLVIAGARDTAWLGVDAGSGGVLYECGAGGCGARPARAPRVLALRRTATTLRALDPTTGTEKWNFSVAEQQLSLSRGGCAGAVPASQAAPALVVALPEGVVAVKRPGDTKLLWSRQLEAPIANMWRLQGDSLTPVDVLWEAARAIDAAASAPPSLYIGLHNTQLYVQEGLLYARKLETAVSTKPLPWKLMNSRPLLDGSDPHTALTLHESDPNTLSLITLYGNTGKLGNHGFFLYLQETCDQAVQTVNTDYPTLPPAPPLGVDVVDEHHVHVHVYSLWYWWKEVLLIAATSALLMNLVMWPRLFSPKVIPAHLPQRHQLSTTPIQLQVERPPQNNMVEYSGRYENDFTPLRCLGRGGFGVVFEARNNIDHCSYAVKRITLPKKQSRRERVLREVRALAKLEHEHIVRYFNAWLEEPPPHWQEARDLLWIRDLESSAPMTENYTATSPTPAPMSSRKDSVLLNLTKCCDTLDQQIDEIPKRYRSLSCNDSISIVFDDNAPCSDNTTNSISTGDFATNTLPQSLKSMDDDSFIQFKNSKDTLPDNAKSLDEDSIQFKNSKDTLPDSQKTLDDDSFIQFKNSKDLSGLSEARNDASFTDSVNKRLERVKNYDGYSRNDSSVSKKKKGHTRHWSLDMCVKSSTDPQPANNSKMYLYIQMQLCQKDSLHDWLRHNATRELRAKEIKVLFSQIVSAVEYVHLAGLIHRDLKPSNIFFAPDGRVKVGDFGLVTTMSDSSTAGEPVEMNMQARHTYRVGTHLYMSPEQVRGRRYSYKVDIYSLGLILFELLQPFGTESERVACLLGIRDGMYPKDFHKNYPGEMEVLKLMLSSEPSVRPTASGVRARAPLYEATDERWHFHLPGPAMHTP